VVPWWWSWLLTAAGLVGLWAAGSRRQWGWMVGCAAQGLWVAYALATRQHGFLVSAFAYAFVYGRNWLLWRREKSGPDLGPP
jgi:hypothetical protein